MLAYALQRHELSYLGVKTPFCFPVRTFGGFVARLHAYVVAQTLAPRAGNATIAFAYCRDGTQSAAQVHNRSDQIGMTGVSSLVAGWIEYYFQSLRGTLPLLNMMH